MKVSSFLLDESELLSLVSRTLGTRQRCTFLIER